MQCNKCKKHKDEKEFHKRDTKRGYQPWCKECQVSSAKNRFKSYYQENIERFRKKGNEQYHRNKKRISELRKINRQKIREETISHYSNGLKKCACCGEKEIKFLAIDHMDNNGAKHRKELGGRGGEVMYKSLKKLNYPPGYQVLCHNCNMAKGLYGECPHKTKTI